MVLWNLYKRRQEAHLEQVVAEAVAKLRAEVKAEVRAEVRAEVKAEVRAEIRAEVRAEALAQINREWATWYNRMMEAQAKGLPFAVPPPANLREPAE